MDKEQPGTKWVFNLNADVAWRRRGSVLEVWSTEDGLTYANEFGTKGVPIRPILTPADLHKSSQGITVEKAKMDCQNEGPFNPATPQAQDVLDEARSIVTGARRQTHGEAERSFQKIARGWSEILGVEVAPFKVALCMDWLKTVRAVDGDSAHRDHFVDKCGYSALAGELALIMQEG